MTQPTIQWGVRQQVPIIPPEDMPAQPPAPAPVNSEGMTEAEYAAALEQQAIEQANWNIAMGEWQTIVLALIADHDEWWSPMVSVSPGGEAEARHQLGLTREANIGNPFVRDIELVTAPTITWTVVPE